MSDRIESTTDSRPSVLLEASSLLGPLTGVGIYARELLMELGQQTQVKAFLASARAELPTWLVNAGQAQSIELMRSRWPARALPFFWDRLGWPFLGDSTTDVVHSLNYWLLPTRHPLVVTLHDLYFMKNSTSGTALGGQFFAHHLHRHKSRASHWIAVSEQTRQDAVELLGLDSSRITVVHEAPRKEFLRPLRPETLEALRSQLQLPKSYFLAYGSDDPRKNRQTLLEAHAEASRRNCELPPLVLVGGAAVGSRGGEVYHLPYLETEALQATLSGALALLQPSHEEGFGLPMVEAMHMGIPLASTKTGVLKELRQDGFLELYPTQVGHMAQALQDLACQSSLRETLSSNGPRAVQGLSWERAARETLQVYKKVMSQKTKEQAL